MGRTQNPPEKVSGSLEGVNEAGALGEEVEVGRGRHTGLPGSREAMGRWAAQRRTGDCRAPGFPGRAGELGFLRMGGEAGFQVSRGGLKESQEALGPRMGARPFTHLL